MNTVLPSVLVFTLDAADQVSIDNARSAVETRLEGAGLNLLINNGAMLQRAGFHDVTMEAMVDHFRVNCAGPLMIVKVSPPPLCTPLTICG